MVMAWEMLSGMPVVQRPHGREEIVAKMLLLNVWTSTPPAATPRAGPTIPRVDFAKLPEVLESEEILRNCFGLGASRGMKM